MVAHSQSAAPAAPADSVSHARAGVLPVRGSAVRELGLPLPPARMPAWRAGRPLKRWRYLGVYSAEIMLCFGHARVAGIPQRWWAVARRSEAAASRCRPGAREWRKGRC